MRKRLIIIASIVALVLLIGFTLAHNKKKINESNKVVDRSSIAIPVTIVKPFRGGTQEQLVLPAVVAPVQETNISINAAGKLKNLDIDLGSRVVKGEVLGSIDNSLKELNLQQTELSVQKLKTDYERYRDLYAGKATTEVEYNNAKYNYENAKIQADQIRQQIADGRVVAPQSGIIVKKNNQPGEFVNMGTVIATVVDVSKLKANVMVSEENVYALHTGQPVNITTDIYPDKSLRGRIRYISPKGDESHNYPVEIEIENTGGLDLKAGTFVKVDFNLKNTSTALLIPKIALVEGMKNPYVYVVNEGKSEVRKLTLGREIGENVEVISGLSEADQVVTSGQINLAQGSRIEIVDNK